MKSSVLFGLIVTLVAVVSVVSAPISNAQSTPVTTENPNQSVRCNIAQARLNTRITQVDKAKVAQTKIYTDLQDKITKIAGSAEAAGYDTVDIASGQTAVKEAVTAYTDKATKYTSALMSTKNLSCGESDDAFTTSLTTTRTTLTDVRNAALDVQSAFKEKAVPALQEYAAWLKVNNPATEETNE